MHFLSPSKKSEMLNDAVIYHRCLHDFSFVCLFRVSDELVISSIHTKICFINIPFFGHGKKTCRWTCMLPCQHTTVHLPLEAIFAGILVVKRHDKHNVSDVPWIRKAWALPPHCPREISVSWLYCEIENIF